MENGVEWLATEDAGPLKQHPQRSNESMAKAVENMERELAAKAYIYNMLINLKEQSRKKP